MLRYKNLGCGLCMPTFVRLRETRYVAVSSLIGTPLQVGTAWWRMSSTLVMSTGVITTT